MQRNPEELSDEPSVVVVIPGTVRYSQREVEMAR